MKKILFVINSLTIGGSEKSLVSLLNLLDYKKLSVDLLMIRKGGEFEKYIPKEVNILDEQEYYMFLTNKKIKISMLQRYKYSFCRIKTSIDLRVNIRKHNPIHAEQIIYNNHKKVLKRIDKCYDIAIAYSQGLPTYFVADNVIAKKKIAWINCDYATTMYNKKYDEVFYDKFNNIVAVSNSIKESIIKMNKNYEKKLKVILDIVDPNLINKMANEFTVFQDKSVINILTVARLVVVHKGYDIAINAAQLLRNNGYKFKWYIVGDGPDKRKMEKMIHDNQLQENVILLGKKDNPYPYMKNCDIYVQPSKKEGFGLTVAEAKILKKIIVCTNFNTASELITNKYDGLIVDQSAEAVYKGIIKYINDSNFKDTICKTLNINESYNSIKEIEKINSLIS